MSGSAEHIIAISPLGELPSALIDRVGKEISRVFNFETALEPVLSDISFAYDSNRDQYNSTTILEKLSVLIPPGCLKILAIVQVDLFIPILTYVYGEAQLGGRSSVVSTARLSDGLYGMALEETFGNRVVKEAIHELGHTFNLRHCKDEKCLMHYCRNEHDVDHKSDQLCRYCRVMLGDEVKRLTRGAGGK